MKFKQKDMSIKWGDQLEFFYLEKKKLRLPPHAHKKEIAHDDWPTTNWSFFNSTAYVEHKRPLTKMNFFLGVISSVGEEDPSKKWFFLLFVHIRIPARKIAITPAK